MASKKMSQSVGPVLRELRILLCPQGKSSAGARSFIETHYNTIKSSLPNTPILVREAIGIEPVVYARFEFGREKALPLANQNSANILQQVQELIGTK